MTISSRFLVMREALGLTRKDFADRVDASPRTIEGIENDGKIPRSDTLERVVKSWPQYALWLLTGSPVPKAPQITPHSKLDDRANIIEVCDPRFMNFSIINPAYIKHGKLTFIQNLERDNSLAVLIELEESMLKMYASEKATKGSLWLSSGYLNFDSSHGGRNELRDFRQWVMSINEDLISNADFKGLSEECFEKAEKVQDLFFSELSEVPTQKLKERFLEWKAGGDYLWP